MPEGVKLTIVNLMKDHWPDEPPRRPIHQWRGCSAIASPGRRPSNGPTAGNNGVDAERRIEAALEAGDSFDAQIVLMTLHAKLISAEVVERFGLSAD